MLSNLPLLLTWLRIAFIPLLVLLFYWQHPLAPLAAATVFGIAGLTDWADGYLARLWQQESRFGAFLDPVADKLIVAVALILIVEREANIWMTSAAIIIIAREIVISALREWMAEVGARGKVAVAFIGKLKTAIQILALIALLYNKDFFGIPMRPLGMIGLTIATLLTLISMIQYLKAAFQSPTA